jgi:stage V sporulation protein R
MPKILNPYGNEWTPALLDNAYKTIEEIAVGEWGLDIYPNQMEIIGSAQMLEAYAHVGMPVMYNHWSFGKKFLGHERQYKRGHMGLAYEMIINSDPCISYLMEENTLTMQVLVTAHAAFGHNFFFKNNDIFRQWTMADFIIEYLRFAKHYVQWCEEKYGLEEVERILDAAHALQHYSVDKYQKRRKLKGEDQERRNQRMDIAEQHYDPLVTPWIEYASNDKDEVSPVNDDLIEPTENILYFIEKSSPVLKSWQRELVRIVRHVGQYFWPQMQTQVMNEGTATYCHHTLITELDKRGLVDESFMMEFCRAHAGVVWQRDLAPLNNPYKLGWEIFKDIQRMCEQPTKEDEQWFPHIVGKPFMPIFKAAVRDFKDESFIQQFVSPKLIRDFGMMSIFDGGPNEENYEVTAVSDDNGYEHIRSLMAEERDINTKLPRIEIVDVMRKQDSRLVLQHQMYRNRPIHKQEAHKTLQLMGRLWGHPIELQSLDSNQVVKSKIVFTPDD